jgi:hypothetical protein
MSASRWGVFRTRVLGARTTEKIKTFAAHPWLVAGTDDECRQIVIPGYATEHVVVRN